MTSVDDELTREATELLAPRHPVFAVARVTPGGTSLAAVGAPPEGDFEIGSISKGVTGMLYAEALSRGEVTPETTLGEWLPLAGSAAAAVTLGALSTHTSGLPRLARSAAPLSRSVALWRHGTNPYGDSLDTLMEQARSVAVGRPRPGYSNLGFMLLGHALAAAAGTTYSALITDRVARPLGLDPFYVAVTPADLRAGAVPGTSRSGRSREPWTGEALGPAGGIRASIGAMARLTEALLDGSAPGCTALDPVRDFSRGLRIGAAWLTLSAQGHELTWHNGGTGGFRSWMGLDRHRRRGVVVLSATTRSVDRIGHRLLTAGTTPS